MDYIRGVLRGSHLLAHTLLFISVLLSYPVRQAAPHTLDIASSNAAVIYYGLPSPVVPAAAGNPWTFPRPRKHATGMFSTLATLGPGFQVQRLISKKSVDKNRQTFL